jgi:flagellar hook-length control protein FliK
VLVDHAETSTAPLTKSDVSKLASELSVKDGVDIRSSLAASPVTSEVTSRLILKDEDVIALAKATTSAQIEHAKSTLSEGQSVTKQRSELITMLQQMSGRIKSIKEEGVASSVVKNPQQAITADNFLSNRATYTADTADVNVLKSVKDNAALLQMNAHKSVNLTSSFIQQKAFQAKPVSEEIIPTALSDKASAPLTLSTTSLDSQSAATQDIQRTAPTAKEFLLNAQNDERIQKAIGDRVMRMVETGKWDTEMELNPTRLGTIRIRMSMDNNEMQLALTSQNASVRDLLETNLPRLRAGLSDSGISLGNTSVNQDSPSQTGSGFNQGQFASNQAANGNVVKTVTDDQIVSDEQKQSNHDGELDTFA